jgi:hypothetical protein
MVTVFPAASEAVIATKCSPFVREDKEKVLELILTVVPPSRA